MTRFRAGRISASLLLSAGLLALGGCGGSVQVRAGTKPDPAGLTRSLDVGKSTQQAVQAALGAPDGQGRSMLPWQKAARSVWSYYYEEGIVDLGGDKSDSRRTFLFVFFDEDRFDGYLWFSSLK